jgi:hypothetical protein
MVVPALLLADLTWHRFLKKESHVRRANATHGVQCSLPSARHCNIS